jgi:hypothetical protein
MNCVNCLNCLSSFECVGFKLSETVKQLRLLRQFGIRYDEP